MTHVPVPDTGTHHTGGMGMSYDPDDHLDLMTDLYDGLTSEDTKEDVRARLEDLGFDVDKLVEDARQVIERAKRGPNTPRPQEERDG